MNPSKTIIWTWADSEHESAVAHGMCEYSLADYRERLSEAVAEAERLGHNVELKVIAVADMMAALEAAGLENTPDNRAYIGATWDKRESHSP